jgi:glyoxylase-like metal-dependent hydrolase (beta-lactamase superfamily II)
MASLSCITLSKQVSYIASPSNVGLYVGPHGTVLIDSGNNADMGRKILKYLRESEQTLRAVALTHSNADHAGGAAFIASRTTVPVYANPIEATFCAYPFLESSFLWGGFPPASLRGKFLMAQSCIVKSLESNNPPEELEGITIISLPGHYFGQCGYFSEGVLFAGDALFGPDSITKHPVFFIYDIEAFLHSLDTIQTLAPSIVVPAHGVATKDITSIINLNRNTVEQIITLILDFCVNPCTQEELLAHFCSHFNIQLDWNQYVLVGSTLRSYLAYLLEKEMLACEFINSRLVWKKK